MGGFRGSVTFAGEQVQTYDVDIHLEEETIAIVADGTVVGQWPLAEVVFRGTNVGLRMTVEGEEVLIRTDDQGRFARAVGLRTGPPELRKKMAVAKKTANKGTKPMSRDRVRKQRRPSKAMLVMTGAGVTTAAAAAVGAVAGGGAIEPTTGLIVVCSLGFLGVLGQLGLFRDV